MDKLALIKQKYGYVSSNETKCTSKPVADKQNTPIKRPESQRKDNHNSIIKPYTDRTQKTMNTNLVSQFCPPPPLKHKEITLNDNNVRQALKEVKPIQNQRLNINQNIVKSYEKTYDLLKNYRNRIITDSKNEKTESQKTLILGNSKTQQEKTQPAQQIDQCQIQAKESFVASQVSQRIQKRGHPKRCSPLQGIDLKGSCNVYAEIDNISRLQSRIQQLIGDRNIR